MFKRKQKWVLNRNRRDIAKLTKADLIKLRKELEAQVFKDPQEREARDLYEKLYIRQDYAD